MTREMIVSKAMSEGRLDPARLEWAKVAPIGAVLAEIARQPVGAFHGVTTIARLSGHDPGKFGKVANRPIRRDGTTDEGTASLADIAARSGHSVAALKRNAARLARLEEEEQGPGSEPDDGDEGAPGDGDELTDDELKEAIALYKSAKAAKLAEQEGDGNEEGVAP